MIRSQIFKEAVVARQPEPVIEVQVAPGGVTGAVYVAIRYVDADARETQAISFSVSG